ncbi:MAG: TonB-dependent receptor family protein, partial [Candidatus Neomarinimicrobiota bacterium]
INYNQSANHNTYLKVNLNYENSNATYTGLTEWSFTDSVAKYSYNGARFNPKEHDNFEIFRTAIDLIDTKQLSSTIVKTNKVFASFFDRRWWRENDIFISPNDLDDYLDDLIETEWVAQPYYSSSDLVRVGDGKSSLGILRTFYVVGLEQSYAINHRLFGFESKMDFGARIYFERFIDDKQKGLEPDSREGLYFLPEDSTIVGQSHHYESTAFSGFISESIVFGNFTLRPGVRFEVFEQERIDRLAGSTYLDKTTNVILPGIGFINQFNKISLFGGVHRGFTPPSSGALKILNFGESSDDGGLDIEAEKSWNKEIGLRGNLTTLDYEISGFHVDIENLVAAGRGTAFSNLGKVQSYGLEVASSFKLTEMVPLLPVINLSYTLMKTEIIEGEIKSNIMGGIVPIEGKELPYAPMHTFIIGMEHQLFNDFNFRYDYKYVDDVFTDFENIDNTGNKGIKGPVESYGISNLSIDYNISNKIRMFISAKNLLDKEYIGSRLHSNPGQPEAHLSSGILPGPRRQINLGIDYNF